MRERSPGAWQLRAFEGVDPISGKKRYRSKSFRDTKREAQKALNALVAEVDRGAVAPAAKTVGALLTAWLEHIEHLGRSPTTLYGYRRLIEQLPDGFKKQPLGKVTPKLVDDLYVHLGTVGRRKPATVLRFHAVLRTAFSQAERWGWIDRSPIDRATPPRVHRKEIRPPEVDAVLKVIAAAEQSRSPENALVLRLLAATGCRRGEVVGLQWGDVDFDADPVTVTIRRAVVEVERELIVKPTKTHAVRTVGLDPDTAALLKAQWTTAVEIGLAGGVPPKPEHFVFPLWRHSPRFRSRGLRASAPGEARDALRRVLESLNELRYMVWVEQASGRGQAEDRADRKPPVGRSAVPLIWIGQIVADIDQVASSGRLFLERCDDQITEGSRRLPSLRG